MTQSRYSTIISNQYLGKTQVIRGMTRQEVGQKASMQIAKWAQQETQQRERYSKAALTNSLKQQAENDTRIAQQQLDGLKNLLVQGLKGARMYDWEAQKDRRSLPPFAFAEVAPTYDQVARELGVPAANSFLEGVFSSKRESRLQKEAQAHQWLQARLADYEARRAVAYNAYVAQFNAFEAGKRQYNASVDEKRGQFDNGDPDVVADVFGQVLSKMDLPEQYGQDVDTVFDLASNTVVITMQLPSPEELPHVSGYRYVASRSVVDPVELKPKDRDSLYESVIHQIALTTLYRAFHDAPSLAVKSIVFNGWVTGVDRATGKDFTSCILSAQASREQFESLQLERVDPKECIRSLKGLVAGPLAQLAPVRPIMELNMTDRRFIESREVLADLNSTDNLATMDWEDFEHLVRELFSKEFGSNGGDVRVTQASRDGGVDAVAFDPDPIRGGKFVIQAKRYNIVVPVSAVRDLYGTMIHEGASKGILVTTSYFGHDAREFAKDKPISLIDGSNLVYLFSKHGYEVTIDLQRPSTHLHQSNPNVMQ